MSIGISAALGAEVERLRHDIERHIAMASELATENEALRTTVSRLREYAKHHPNCDSSAPECCCGLDRLLEESK